MELRTTHFLIPKKDSKPSECEDGLSIDTKNLRFSVSDGASDAFDSRRWARILNAAWKRCTIESLFSFDEYANNLVPLAQKWSNFWTQKILPWYGEAKLQKGAYTAFLGFEIRKNEDKFIWQAISVGDCCLFILQENSELTTSFPLVSPDDFGLAPYLISTNSSDFFNLQLILKEKTGILNYKDQVLIMSDAISQWYLKYAVNNLEKRLEFLKILRDGDREKFNIFVDNERESNSLRNDDIAVVYLSIS